MMAMKQPYKVTPEGVKRTSPAPKQTVYGNKTLPGRLLKALGGQMETKRAQDWAKSQKKLPKRAVRKVYGVK